MLNLRRGAVKTEMLQMALAFQATISNSMRGSGGRFDCPLQHLRTVLLGPHGPGEVRCIERWLATARLALVTSALFPVWMEPNQISWCAQWLLSIEIVDGTVAHAFVPLSSSSPLRRYDLSFMLWTCSGSP